MTKNCGNCRHFEPVHGNRGTCGKAPETRTVLDYHQHSCFSDGKDDVRVLWPVIIAGILLLIIVLILGALRQEGFFGHVAPQEGNIAPIIQGDARGGEGAL